MSNTITLGKIEVYTVFNQVFPIDEPLKYRYFLEVLLHRDANPQRRAYSHLNKTFGEHWLSEVFDNYKEWRAEGCPQLIR